MADIRIVVDEDLKKEAEKVLKNLELSMSQSVRMFLRQMVKMQGMPFNPYQRITNDPNNRT
jgi:DNA-damage-inducible protein J